MIPKRVNDYLQYISGFENLETKTDHSPVKQQLIQYLIIELPSVRKFNKEKALGEYRFKNLKSFLTSNEYFLKSNFIGILDDLEKYIAEYKKGGDILSYIDFFGDKISNLIELLSKVISNEKKILSSAKKVIKYLDDNEYKDFLILDKNINLMEQDLRKLKLINKKIKTLNTSEGINYFLSSIGIDKDKFNDIICTLNEKEFSELLNFIDNSKVDNLIKNEFYIFVIILRNLMLLYIPFIDYMYISLNSKKDFTEIYIDLYNKIITEKNINIHLLGDYIYVLYDLLDSFINEGEIIEKFKEISKKIGINSLIDIYTNSGNDKKVAENIIYLHNNGLLIGLKTYLDTNPNGLIEYIDFVSNRFFKEYPGMIQFIDFSNLDFYYEKLLNRKGTLSNNEKAFALQYGFLEKDNKIIKSLLFLYENTELTEKELVQLTGEQIEMLEKNYTLPKEYIQKIISGEDMESVIAQYKVEKYKQKIQNKLSYIPQIGGFTDIKSKIDNLLKELDTENFDKQETKLEKIWKQNLEPMYKKIEKLVSYNILDLKNIHKFINVLLEKKTKKNGLKLSNILEILDYLFSTYDKQEVDFVLKLVNNSNLQISNNFLDNYNIIFKTILSNSNIIYDIKEINKSLSLFEIYEIISNKDNEKYAQNLINTYFPEKLSEEVYEIYKKSKDKFNKLVTIAKLIKNKDDEDFYLELMVLDEINFKKFYFLVKNLNILGIDTSGKYKELFNLIDKLSEDKLKNLKKLLKDGKFIDFDKDFFYDLLMDYITIEELDISIFEVLFIKNNDIEEDNIFEKNTGIIGLAGFSGKDVISKLDKLGFEIKRVRGSHYIMYNEKTHTYTIVPYHNKVKAKLLFDMLNRLKIKKEKFLEM